MQNLSKMDRKCQYFVNSEIGLSICHSVYGMISIYISFDRHEIILDLVLTTDPNIVSDVVNTGPVAANDHGLIM